MPRATKQPGKARHDPLHVQLGEDELHAKYGRISRPGKRSKAKEDDEEEGGEVILDPKTSRRIFELARDQQEELGAWEDEDEADEDGDKPAFSVPRIQKSDDEDDDDLERFGDDDFEEDVEEIVSGMLDESSSVCRSVTGSR